MEDKWCPENDGAFRMELAALHRDDPMQLLHRARAEITQLRAELEQERELADRLAGAIDAADWHQHDANMMDLALTAHATRRNK